MKLRIIILLFLALTISVLTFACDSPIYTSDEVIAISKELSDYKYDHRDVVDWSAEYQGKGKWLVHKTVTSHLISTPISVHWYFYEKSQTLEYCSSEKTG